MNLMTTLIMPSDYGIEMLVGSSPIVSPGFLSNSSYYSDFARCGTVWSSSTNHYALTDAITTKARPCSQYGFSSFSNFTDCPPVVTSASATPFSRSASFRSSARNSIRRRKCVTIVPPSLLQLKPCLMAPRVEEPVICNSEGVVSPSREKKKVSFADNIGQCLEDVKLIDERPDCPPNWSQEFYNRVTGGASTDIETSRWELTFAQPSADYMQWKGKLESNCVALENAYIKNKDDQVTGQVKVINMAFHKEVRIRYTSDSWATFDECEGIFASMPNATATYNLYDTFVFKFPLPFSTTMDKVEFCVQYITDGREFWDNNSGKNFAIVSMRPQDKQTPENTKAMDVYQRSMEHWSLYTNWGHGFNERYY